MAIVHISGKDKGDIILYVLSTCGWCRKTKELLVELGVEHSYIFVDLLEGDEREKVMAEVRKYNSQMNFPTLVINGKQAIVGFKEDKIRQVLG